MKRAAVLPREKRPPAAPPQLGDIVRVGRRPGYFVVESVR